MESLKYYFQVKNDKIITESNLPTDGDGISNIEISEQVFENWQVEPNRYYVVDGVLYTKTDEEMEEEKEREERERIAILSLTRGDVFRGLLQARGITRAELRALIEKLPTTVDEKEVKELVIKKELALIDFDEALDFYRGNPLIDTIGAKLDITSEQLNNFFSTNDWHYLLPNNQ